MMIEFVSIPNYFVVAKEHDLYFFISLTLHTFAMHLSVYVFYFYFLSGMALNLSFHFNPPFVPNIFKSSKSKKRG